MGKHVFVLEAVTKTKIEVILTDEDMTPEAMEEYRQSFSNITDLQGHAKQLAYALASQTHDSEGFCEGYGHVNIRNWAFPKALEKGEVRDIHLKEIGYSDTKVKLLTADGVAVKDE